MCGEGWHAIKGPPLQLSRLGTWYRAFVCVCVWWFGGEIKGGMALGSFSLLSFYLLGVCPDLQFRTTHTDKLYR